MNPLTVGSGPGRDAAPPDGDAAPPDRDAAPPARQWSRYAVWLLLPVAWVLAAVVSALPGARVIQDGVVSQMPWRTLFVDQLVAYGWWAALFPLILLATLRIAELPAPAWGRALLHVLAGGLFAVAYFLLRSNLQLPGQFRLSAGWAGLRSILPFATAIYLIIVTGILAARSHSRVRQREREAAALALEASSLQAQLTEARLELLRAQLHPHFLFNALHAISALIDHDGVAARTMLARLSELLRLSLNAMESPEITLAQELEWLEQYAELQQLRYDERLRFDMYAAPDALSALVPPLVLQPLVENAIKHAVEPRRQGGRVQVRVERSGATLRLAVSDDGPGPSATGSTNGVGLRNTRDRLAALYGTAQSVSLTAAAGGGAEAVVSIPYRDAAPA